MKELVVISGKGGTGKTSVAAAFATFASRAASPAVFADCDVDAADLHLIFSPRIERREVFVSGREALIDQSKCVSCGECARLCRFDAVREAASGRFSISGCEGCGACVSRCPSGAIEFPDRRCGEWYLSDTRFGPLVHARLDAEAENSGKLVSLVRREARAKAEAVDADFIIVDGCPGIGCPVIASITGVDAALAVVEPSLSSLHDLERIIELTRHFEVPLSVVINKADVNLEIALSIVRTCSSLGVSVVGAIPYDTVVTAAQLRGLSVVEHDEHCCVSKNLLEIWRNLTEELWKR